MSDWLQEAMAAFGVSERQQLAELLGVHASMITYMERHGVTRKGLHAMRKAAALAEVELPGSVEQAFLDRPVNGDRRGTAA